MSTSLKFSHISQNPKQLQYKNVDCLTKNSNNLSFNNSTITTNNQKSIQHNLNQNSEQTSGSLRSSTMTNIECPTSKIDTTTLSRNNILISHDIKQLLNHNTIQRNYDSEKKKPHKYNFMTQLISSSSQCSNSQCNSGNRINSETNWQNASQTSQFSLFSSVSPGLGNREKIAEAMRHLKIQKSSLDHQRYTYEKLFKSKAKCFCLVVGYDKKKNLVKYLNYILGV